MSFLVSKLKNIYDRCYWKMIPILWYFIPQNRKEIPLQKEFSISVVTYIDRFETYFKTLVKHLNFTFPNTQLVIVINGHYDTPRQKIYLQKATAFLSKYPQVKMISFQEPQSLAKLWNLSVINADAEKILILNDDLRLSPSFAKEFYKSKILKAQVALINRSWSHFLISKSIVDKVGWFDERFPAFGNEDQDYEARLIFAHLELPNYRMKQIFNVVEVPKAYSYGEKIELVHVKYAKLNQDFFNTKWEQVSEKRHDYLYIPVLNAYLKLKDGMETPDFYKK